MPDRTVSPSGLLWKMVGVTSRLQRHRCMAPIPGVFHQHKKCADPSRPAPAPQAQLWGYGELWFEG